MAYKLRVSERADALLDELLNHLIYNCKNQQAAKHLLDSMNKIYNRLEENPAQFPYSRDDYLCAKGYQVAIISDMDYIIVFTVREDIVLVVGIYHQLENYQRDLL